MILASSLLLSGLTLPGAATPPPDRLRGALVTAAQATESRLGRLKGDGFNAVALLLTERASPRAIDAAAGRARAAGLDLYYWIEICRCPALADAHPEWMASLQGHPEWRRHFPKAPLPAEGEVVKCYPWVPVLYREAFDAHLARVRKLLEGRPAPRGIFLNDLQAAPSACGCGHILCRWTPDYGPLRTATHLEPDAAARFVAAVATLTPAAVIPVWAPECEEADAAKEGACAGVGCFEGRCWYAWTEQLMPVARQCRTLAALLPFRALGRSDPRYGPPGAWVAHALRSFAEMPPKRRGAAVPPDRWVAVLQGWDVSAAERDTQFRAAGEAGGTLLALTEIDQRWEPRIVRIPDGKVGQRRSHRGEHGEGTAEKIR
jgi:hypothetical protein